MKRHSLALPASGRLFLSGLGLSAISASSPGVARAWPDPLPTRLKRVEKMYRTYGGRS